MSRGWNGKQQTVDKEKRDRDEQPEGEATVLPAREAMSLIEAAGSASGEERVTSEDRGEHSERRDSASSET